jgi:hypothetical protein
VSSIGTVGHLPRRSPAAKKSRGEAKAPGRWKRRCTGGGGGEGRPGEDGGAGEDGGKMPTTTAWPVAGCLLDWAGKVSVVEILHGLTSKRRTFRQFKSIRTVPVRCDGQFIYIFIFT